MTSGVVRLVDFAILRSCSNLSDVCSVASLPIESTSLFFLSWRLNGVGPLPRPAATTTTVRRQGLPVSRRARCTWTTTLGVVQKTLHLGATLLATQDGLNEYARDKRPGLLVPHFAGCHATPRRSRPKPQQPGFAAPHYASMLQICRTRTPHLPTSLREQPAQASVSPLSIFCCFRPVRNYAQGKGMHTGIKTRNNQ